MTRPFPLAQQTDGINLARQKGGASPSGLVELKNGYIDKNGRIVQRGGLTRIKEFPGNTVGVVFYNNKFHTFCAVPAATSDPDIVVNVLRHPTDGTAKLSKVHFVEPVLGKLYVAAEFADGVKRHYWLDVDTVWTANTDKLLGARVTPTVPNGYYYANKTQNLSDLLWAPNTTVTVGVFKQPTVANSFKYEVTATTGTAPIRTSNTEPTWPTTSGATVVERRYITEAQTDPGDDTPPTEDPNVDPIHGTDDDPFWPYGRGKSV